MNVSAKKKRPWETPKFEALFTIARIVGWLMKLKKEWGGN